MNYKQILQTNNKTAGVNTCQFIVLHHTATADGTIKGVLNTLTVGKVSCHYVVDTNGDVYKIGNDKDILWHAGESAWGKLKNINAYSIWIEVIWPLKNGGFTDDQRKSVENLIKELAQKYAIPKENILRHADLTWSGSEKQILWDGKSKSRKIDISNTFWNNKFNSFAEYKDFLFFKNTDMSKYSQILQNAIKETGEKPIFSDHSWNWNLTEQEIKELIDIACLRVIQRLKK